MPHLEQSVCCIKSGPTPRQPADSWVRWFNDVAAKAVEAAIQMGSRPSCVLSLEGFMFLDTMRVSLLLNVCAESCLAVGAI
jgi:hypothetical protein